MDIVSHAIIGRMLATPKKNNRNDMVGVMFFAALPDFFQIPLYLFLGHLNHRPFNWPLNSDWIGFRTAYPEWILWWDIPHSLLFLLLIVVPFILIFKLNKLFIAAYFSHLFIDLFTHTGEWGVKPFFPFNFLVSGFTDAWAWNPIYFPVAWAILILIVLLIDRSRQALNR